MGAAGTGFCSYAHEIRYLRPATYNESVAIRSALIGWGDSSLLVEMCMFGKDGQLKAILWTTFTRIHPATGKKMVHPPEFQPWIDLALVEGIAEKGLIRAHRKPAEGSSALTDQHPGDKNYPAADNDLQHCLQHSGLHISVTHPCDHKQFDDHDGNRQGHGRMIGG